jgi:hypothetical protein
MALRYYPLTMIKTDLYTRGQSFKLPNGTPYTGLYYITYDGRAFAGANPVIGTNEELTPIQQRLDESRGGKIINVNSSYYDASLKQKGQQVDDLDSTFLTELKPYYPFPLEEDYTKGYFMRYFAKTVSGPGYVFEISESDFASLSNQIVSPGILGYEYTNMLWQLTGPLEDTRVSQYQVKGGVLTTNKRVTIAKNETFPGLVEYIGGNYTKYARVDEETL